MSFFSRFLVVLLVIVLIGAIVYFGLTPGGRATLNRWFFAVQKADDATSYRTIKQVEDTARAMIASYNADKSIYNTYADSTKEEEQGWAQQAVIRANTTVSSYNNYILKNTFVWKGNVPADIFMELPLIGGEQE